MTPQSSRKWPVRAYGIVLKKVGSICAWYGEHGHAMNIYRTKEEAKSRLNDVTKVMVLEIRPARTRRKR